MYNIISYIDPKNDRIFSREISVRFGIVYSGFPEQLGGYQLMHIHDLHNNFNCVRI